MKSSTAESINFRCMHNIFFKHTQLMLWYANIIMGMHTAFYSNKKYTSTHNTIAYSMKIILHILHTLHKSWDKHNAH